MCQRRWEQRALCIEHLSSHHVEMWLNAFTAGTKTCRRIICVFLYTNEEKTIWKKLFPAKKFKFHLKFSKTCCTNCIKYTIKPQMWKDLMFLFYYFTFFYYLKYFIFILFILNVLFIFKNDHFIIMSCIISSFKRFRSWVVPLTPF